MKIYFKSWGKSKAVAMALAATAVMAPSCSDSFLDEDNITAPSTDLFSEQDGIDQLVVGAYQKLKFKFNYIWAIQCYNMGVDEFTDGNNMGPTWNHYTSDLNSTEAGANAPMWDNYYGAVEPANIIIENVQKYYDKSSKFYNTRLGEGYFIRAYAYFELVKQFGGVPLKLAPTTTLETYFVRNTEEECYAQIIKDFETAYGLLPDKPDAPGRITKSAAAHFIAKACLFRSSELYAGWNAKYKNEDLDAVIKYGDEVIAAHPLCNDFVELWDYQTANGANEQVGEVVLAAQFSDDATTWGRFGNQMHLYYPSVYQDLAGTKRDISGDREFSYVSTTEYTIEVFDRVNDSRFWKSFITTYGCNNPAGALDYDSAEVAGKIYGVPDGVKGGEKRFKGGEIGVKYIVNAPGDNRYKQVPSMDKKGTLTPTKNDPTHVAKNGMITAANTFVRYMEGEAFNWNTDVTNTTGNYYGIVPHKRGVALSKFRDGLRNSVASQFGTRDAIIARSADDVLMVAEAYVRKGDYANAFKYVNMLRDRAGYAAGEDRAKHVDGGQAYKNNKYCSGNGGGYSPSGAIYCETNTYFESNDLEGQEAAVNATETKSKLRVNSVADILAGPDARILEKLGVSSDADVMLNFILNERTRELIGESHRWEDLARTKTLEARFKAFNDANSRQGAGAFDAKKHYYRPIPQTFLDGVTNAAGQALSDSEKEAMQNPGY